MLLNWQNTNRNGWSYRYEPGKYSLIIYELSKIPDFSEPRFAHIGEKLEERRAEIAKRQGEMIRQLHKVGGEAGFSLRLRKDHQRLRLFLIVKVSGDAAHLNERAEEISNVFPKEYNFHRITPENNARLWELATDLSWAKQISEILKPEATYPSPYPEGYPYFYIVSLWQPQAQNSLETFCRALLRQNGEAALDLLLQPTYLAPDERDWISLCDQELRESLNGKKIFGRDGRLVHSFDPLPLLKSPYENYEEFLKRSAAQNLQFLYAFRIFSSSPAGLLVESFTTTSTRTHPQILSISPGHPLFEKELRTAQALCCLPEATGDFWKRTVDIPWRAQRLHRLIDQDELGGTFRLPIPLTTGFPGFPLDTGMNLHVDEEEQEGYYIELGSFTDDPAKTNQAARFNQEELTRHGLIVGVPGSGKTTSLFNILYQLWDRPAPDDRIPFIVLEPAKTEYRALKELPLFRQDLLVFTLGDERISPFRFNPFEVPQGIPLESHISKLNACFIGAFNLFDPLPLLLDKAIRQTYEAKQWYDDSVGGEPGLEPPTISDLVREAEKVIKSSGYSDRMRDDFNAALLQRLESLRRGSKGRMLDTRTSISAEILMNRPVVLELDALNEDEKALLMMFILTFVYEHGKSTSRSGSPLRHVLVVEEAHNLIGRGEKSGTEYRANPKEHAIRLFVRMLAEMRALGQGLLVCDQLPSALAPEAMKQTNLKILMRLTAMDDREEIGNTMDLNEAHLKDVVHFSRGQAYVYLEGWDRVRRIQSLSFKKEHQVDEPPEDAVVKRQMEPFEVEQAGLYMPFADCRTGCAVCDRRVRSQAERYIRRLMAKPAPQAEPVRNLKFYQELLGSLPGDPAQTNPCRFFLQIVKIEAYDLRQREGQVQPTFPFCAYLHYLNTANFDLLCEKRDRQNCECQKGREAIYQIFLSLTSKMNPGTASGGSYG